MFFHFFCHLGDFICGRLREVAIQLLATLVRNPPIPPAPKPTPAVTALVPASVRVRRESAPAAKPIVRGAAAGTGEGRAQLLLLLRSCHCLRICEGTCAGSMPSGPPPPPHIPAGPGFGLLPRLLHKPTAAAPAVPRAAAATGTGAPSLDQVSTTGASVAALHNAWRRVGCFNTTTSGPRLCMITMCNPSMDLSRCIRLPSPALPLPACRSIRTSFPQ